MSLQINTSPASTTAQNSAVSNLQQRLHNFKDLFAALKSGDLSSAQSAYAALTAGANSNAASIASPATNSTGPFAQIGQALENGDLAGAQKAALALLHTRGGHHLHGGPGANANGIQPLTTSTTAGSIINTTA